MLFLCNSVTQLFLISDSRALAERPAKLPQRRGVTAEGSRIPYCNYHRRRWGAHCCHKHYTFTRICSQCLKISAAHLSLFLHYARYATHQRLRTLASCGRCFQNKSGDFQLAVVMFRVPGNIFLTNSLQECSCMLTIIKTKEAIPIF